MILYAAWAGPKVHLDTTQGAEAVADVCPQLIEEAEADDIAIPFILDRGPAEVDSGFAARLLFREALAN